MPREPTILVTGSQAISTRFGATWASLVLVIVCSSPVGLVAGQQLVALGAPLGFLVHRPQGEASQRADHGAVHGGRGRGDPRAGRLVHERHELVRETRHGAGDADPAHVW